MAEVICDTSFLIHLANRRILNIDRTHDVGAITFVVPEVVLGELRRLSSNPGKRFEAQAALEYAEHLKTVPIGGTFADEEILRLARGSRVTVATMDRNLKRSLFFLCHCMFTEESRRNAFRSLL